MSPCLPPINQGPRTYIPYNAIAPPVNPSPIKATYNTGIAPNSYPFDAMTQVNALVPFISVNEYERVRNMALSGTATTKEEASQQVPHFTNKETRNTFEISIKSSILGQHNNGKA